MGINWLLQRLQVYWSKSSSLIKKLTIPCFFLFSIRSWCDECECCSASTKEESVVCRALIADGPSCVFRWTFIYFTTSWVDSEHLQRAGPAPTKLMCVYTLGRLRETPATGEMRLRILVPITNTLAVLLNPPEEERVRKSRQIHHFCIWSLSRCCLVTQSISQSFFGTWFNCSCGSTSLFSHLARLQVVIYFFIDWDCRPLQTMTTCDQLEWDRGVLLWGYWLLSKFT